MSATTAASVLSHIRGADITDAAALTSVDEPAESSRNWKLVNAQDLRDLKGARKPEPDVFRRADGVCLFYRGRVNGIHGESESGKSWLALEACRQVLQDGGRVLYLDFEAYAEDMVERLYVMGTLDSTFDLLTYVQVIESDAETFDEICAQAWDLVVLDGVTNAIDTLIGGGTREEDAVARFFRRYPTRLATKTGACVVLIDHISKSNTDDGKTALGSQHKRATMSGASYFAKVERYPAEGHLGVLSLRVAKDRLGGVRRHLEQQTTNNGLPEAALVEIDSTYQPKAAPTVVRLNPPRSHAARLVVQYQDNTHRVVEYLQATPTASIEGLRAFADIAGVNKAAASDLIRVGADRGLWLATQSSGGRKQWVIRPPLPPQTITT